MIFCISNGSKKKTIKNNLTWSTKLKRGFILIGYTGWYLCNKYISGYNNPSARTTT